MLRRRSAAALARVPTSRQGSKCTTSAPAVSLQQSNYSTAAWLPFTANEHFEGQARPRVVSSGSGMHFRTAEGRDVLDASAGLWCSAAGICPPPVVAAVQEQAAKLTYASSFQMSHDGAYEWAEALAAEGGLRQRGLSKVPRQHAYTHYIMIMVVGDGGGGGVQVFFTMCGSTSVDTALKIALAYHRARGQSQRTRFIGRERVGDTPTHAHSRWGGACTAGLGGEMCHHAAREI
jgi:beta-alanine--pyruvate transaminase